MAIPFAMMPLASAAPILSHKWMERCKEEMYQTAAGQARADQMGREMLGRSPRDSGTLSTLLNILEPEPEPCLTPASFYSASLKNVSNIFNIILKLGSRWKIYEMKDRFSSHSFFLSRLWFWVPISLAIRSALRKIIISKR